MKPRVPAYLLARFIRACAPFKQRFHFYRRSCVPRNRVSRTATQIITAAYALIEPQAYVNSSA